MSLRVNFNILNQKGTPAFYSDVFSNRPAAGFAGRVFISTDTGAIYEDTGTAWTLIADAGAGTTGTLQQVTTNGNTTSLGLVVTAGNVAIGTATAGAPLDIHCTGTAAQFNGTGTNNAYVFFQNAGTNKWRFGNNYNANANSLDFFNSGLAAVIASFNANGSLLLNYNLAIKQGTGFNQVSGYSNIATDSGGFFFNNGGANNGYLNFANLTNSRSYTFPDANGTLALTSQIPAASQWTTSGSNIYFATGSVGIGTTNVVEGTQAAGSLSIIKSSSVGGGALIQFAGNGRIRPADTGDRFSIDGNALYLNSTFAANIIANTAGGNFLIGTTTDNSYKLGIDSGAGSNLIWFSRTNGANAQMFIGGANGAGTQFYVSANNSNGVYLAAGGVAWIAASDERLKEDLLPIENGLNKVVSLRSVIGKYKTDKIGTKRAFLIAQDVLKVLPEAVNTNIQTGDLGVSYTEVIPLLVAAIKELKIELDEIKNR